MTTYYVSPTGSNTFPYDTWTKAANQPAYIAGLNPGVGTHNVYIAPGDYTVGLSLGANWAGSTWITTAAHGSTVPANSGQVTVMSDSTHTLYLAFNNIIMDGIFFKDTIAGKNLIYYTGDGCVLNNCDFSNPGAYGIRNSGTGLLTLNNPVIWGNSTAPSFFLGSGNMIINNPIFKNYGTALADYHVQNNGAGDVVINNGVVLGGGKDPLFNSATGSIKVYNSVIKAGNTYNATCAVRTNGVVEIDHCILIPNWYQNTLGTFFTGAVTDTNNIKLTGLKFKRHQRGGIIVPCVDDAGGHAYAASVAALLAARGQHGTFFVESSNISNYLAGIQAVESVGSMEIGFHGRTHSDLSKTGNIFSITAAGKTITVDRTADTIAVSDLGTVTGFKAKTLTAIRTELTAMGCTVGAITTNLAATLRGEIIADSAGAQASGYSLQLLIDATGATGFYKDEITDGKTEIDTLLGAASYSFATPYGLTSDGAESAAKASGLWGMRVLTPLNGWQFAASINVYKLGLIGYTIVLGASDAETVRNTYALCESLAHNGGIVFLLSHTDGELPLAKWPLVLDVLAEYSDIQVLSMKGALDYIRAGWTTADDITYTRTSWPAEEDYHLQPESLCINAGDPATAVTPDFDSVTRPQGPYPDIGAYEHSSQASDELKGRFNRYTN